MSQLQNLHSLVTQFKETVDKDPSKAMTLLTQLKKRFITLSTFLPTGGSATAVSTLTKEQKEEVQLVRETLEYATLLCAKLRDLSAFELNFSQVKSYFSRTDIEKSDREYLILGLNLLRLLSQNRIAEFHTELELIPIAQHSNMYIKQPIEIELFLMEGSYHKLRNARDKVPADEYLVFMDIMMETVRKEIADCMEKAYKSLDLADAQKLLFVDSASQLSQFVQMRNWSVHGTVIHFVNPNEAKSAFTDGANDIIGRTLTYAKELERIV